MSCPLHAGAGVRGFGMGARWRPWRPWRPWRRVGPWRWLGSSWRLGLGRWLLWGLLSRLLWGLLSGIWLRLRQIRTGVGVGLWSGLLWRLWGLRRLWRLWLRISCGGCTHSTAGLYSTATTAASRATCAAASQLLALLQESGGILSLCQEVPRGLDTGGSPACTINPKSGS